MKIKIIDLLNLVYEKKAPKMIRVKHGKTYEIYKYDEDLRWYQTLDRTTLMHILKRDSLELEVEIIEERPEEIIKYKRKSNNVWLHGRMARFSVN